MNPFETNSKSTNPVRTVKTRLTLNGKEVAVATVQKRSKSDKHLAQEIVYWAKQFGLVAGPVEEAKASKAPRTRTPRKPKVDAAVVDADSSPANGQSELLS